MLRQALGVTAGSGGIISALLAGGWTGVVLLVALVVVLVGAVCWVIADDARPERLALLITSWRGRIPPAQPRRPTGRANDGPVDTRTEKHP